MPAELWIGEARTRLAETGGGRSWSFAPAEVAGTLAQLAGGLLSASGVVYEPVGGHFMGLPSLDMPDCLLAGWLPDEPSDWVEARPFANDTGAAVGLHHTADGPWRLTEASPAGWGEPRYLSFITYEQPGEGGTGGELVVAFGGAWRLTLQSNGDATLEELAAGLWQSRAGFGWMSSERFACRGGVLHRLWIYEVGPKLVIRNLAAANGGAPGLSLLDTGAQPNPLCPVTEPYPHALRPGPWRIEGSGRITLGVGRQRFVPGLCRLSATPVAIGLDGGSQPVRIALAALSSGAVGGPEVNVYDESGALWPTTGAIGTRRRAAGWRATWTSTTDSTSYITGVALSVAPLAEDDGASGADLLLTSADRECGLSIDGDRARERLVARIFDPGAGLAAYIRPNSHVRHAVDGVTRFRGLTDAAEWLSAAGGTPPTGQLVLRAQGLWKRFRHAHWPGGEPFDGRLLVDCLRDLAAAAGLAESELDLPDWDYRFPAPPDGVAAALDYRPGTTIDRILEDLRQKLLGAQAACYFRLSDGRFVLEPAPGAEPAATFHERAAEAAAAGEPEQVVQAGTYRETLDESELANIVTVIGRRCDGVPLVAQAVDFDSIGDPEAANYVGEPWPLEVFDPGLQSAAAVAYACRRLFERHRRARVLAIWRSVALPLCPGQTVALRGGLWRLDGLTASYGAEQPRGLCTYSAEALA